MSDMSPQRVTDETTYEILRDEWELLLAVGTGPTDREIVIERLGHAPEDLEDRLALLIDVGLLTQEADGLSLVPAFHQRQEGMSSCLRDLVIRRLELGQEEPFAYWVRCGLGQADDIKALIARLEAETLPSAFEAASVPASDSSTRFSIFFAVAAGAPGVPISGGDSDETTEPLIRLLRQAAIERAQSATRDTSKLWIADVRVDEDVALRIADLFESFLAEAPSTGGMGSAGFAIIESRPR